MLRAVLKKGLSSLEAMATVGELLFMRFLSPAIIYPVRAVPELSRTFKMSIHVPGTLGEVFAGQHCRSPMAS